MTRSCFATHWPVSPRTCDCRFRYHRVDQRAEIAAVGRTMAEVIRLRRLNGAALEPASVAGQKRRISEIARSWGFTDDSRFGRAFRAHYGITPTESRSRSGEIWEKIREWKDYSTASDEGAEISFWLRTLRT